MKSEQLQIVEEVEDEGDGEDLFGDDFGGEPGDEIDYGSRLGPIERLEHEIQRRLDRKNMRKSPITLFELITELKNIEKEERRRRRMTVDHSDDSLIDADDVVSIAHEEGFQESSLTRLAEYLEGLEIDEEMTLAELCEKMEWGIPGSLYPAPFPRHRRAVLAPAGGVLRGYLGADLPGGGGRIPRRVLCGIILFALLLDT